MSTIRQPLWYETSFLSHSDIYVWTVLASHQWLCTQISRLTTKNATWYRHGNLQIFNALIRTGRIPYWTPWDLNSIYSFELFFALLVLLYHEYKIGFENWRTVGYLWREDCWLFLIKILSYMINGAYIYGIDTPSVNLQYCSIPYMMCELEMGLPIISLLYLENWNLDTRLCF